MRNSHASIAICTVDENLSLMKSRMIRDVSIGPLFKAPQLGAERAPALEKPREKGGWIGQTRRRRIGVCGRLALGRQIEHQRMQTGRQHMLHQPLPMRPGKVIFWVNFGDSLADAELRLEQRLGSSLEREPMPQQPASAHLK